MGTATSEGTRHAALAVASRRRLLEVLRSADEPSEVSALAATVGLHLTTARFHLQVLERAGLVQRAAVRRGRPGRPRQLYVATGPAEAADGYRRLADVFAEALAADPSTGPDWAEQAGWRWADSQIPAGRQLSWEEGTRRVGALFARLGFGPRLVDDARQRHLELELCPFRDLARTYPQIVCAVHLGLLRGALSQLGVPLSEPAALRPFVEPQLCIADVPMPLPPEKASCPAAAR